MLPGAILYDEVNDWKLFAHAGSAFQSFCTSTNRFDQMQQGCFGGLNRRWFGSEIDRLRAREDQKSETSNHAEKARVRTLKSYRSGAEIPDLLRHSLRLSLAELLFSTRCR